MNDSLPRIFDVHVHVDSALKPSDLTVSARNVIFNDVEEYRAFARETLGESDTLSLIVDIGSSFEYVRAQALAGAIQGLKIHSRVQRLREADWAAVMSKLADLPELPVIVDAFYYGKDLDVQPSLRAIIALAERFPDRRFVIAHCGGYKLLEYFLHLRELPNIWYDLSFALQYLEESSIWADLRKLIRFTDKKHILFGSDHPFASAARQFHNFMNIARELELSPVEVDDVLYANAVGLFHKLSIV